MRPELAKQLESGSELGVQRYPAYLDIPRQGM
jgi:hypothetical protein